MPTPKSNRASAAQLGGLLRGLRERAGLTLRQVGALAEAHPEPVTYDYLSRVEAGQLLPSPAKLLTLAHVYEVPAQRFLDVLELGQFERLAPRLRDPEALREAGLAAAKGGDFPRAYAAFLRGLELARQGGPAAAQTEMKLRISLAIALARLSKVPMAEQQILRVLEERALSADLAARAWNMLSHIEYLLDRLDLAAAAAVMARRKAHAARDAGQRAQALINLANVRFDRGDIRSALALYRKTLPAWPAGAPSSDRVLALVNIGNCEHALGQQADAARTFSTAVSEAEALPDRRLEASARIALGRSLYQQGLLDDARTPMLVAHALGTSHSFHSEAFHSAFYLWRIALASRGGGGDTAELFRVLKRLRLRVGHRTEEVVAFDAHLAETQPRGRRKGEPHALASELSPVRDPHSPASRRRSSR